MNSDTDQYRKEHIRQGISHNDIRPHEQTIKYKPDQPDDKIPDIRNLRTVILAKQKEIRNLNRNHGRKHRTDQV